MKRRDLLQSLPAAALLPATNWLSSLDNSQGQVSSGRTAPMVYELQVYHIYEGKLDDLLRRFREHTMRLFEKHGIRNVAYWTPIDEPLKGRTLFYILAHSSREAATANWDAFRNDPEWQAVRDKSEANGKLVEKSNPPSSLSPTSPHPCAELRPLSRRVSSFISSLFEQASGEPLPLRAVFPEEDPPRLAPKSLWHATNSGTISYLTWKPENPAGSAVITPD